MGRSFQTEIELLNNTYRCILNSEVIEVEKFLLSISNQSLIIVGSGGSFSVAKAFEYFYQRAGGILSKAITPFELINYNTSLKNMGVVLLTAGGNNPDTINAFKFITKFEPSSFLTLSTNENSKVGRVSNQYTHILYQKSLPSGKDGFLAVNSLIAMILIITKAYENIVDNCFFKLEEKFDFLCELNISENIIKTILDKESIIVLHGGMTTPVAIDLESKFTEAALGIIQLADYRNFAHGRHYWLAKNSECTSIIALISPNEKVIAQKTLSLIPKNVPIYEVITEKDSVMGMLELFRTIFRLTMCAGKLKNIDPGKPKVPEFGRKLYHISYNNLTDKKYKALDGIENRAAYRKCGSVNTDIWKQYKQAFSKFYKNIMSIKFGGIIFDYDCTIKDKSIDIITESRIYEYLNQLLDNRIHIGIATGRGKSARFELQAKISEKHWDSVHIAYYNGGEISSLSNDNAPDTNNEIFESLRVISNDLGYRLKDSIMMDSRPMQLSVLLKNISEKTIIDIIREICLKHSDIKVLQSGHSLDIIPLSSSKLNIFQVFDQTQKYLCFGDSGEVSGNDYELLSHEFGISVKNVSPSFDTCWNFAPLGIKNSVATLFYLEALKLLGNGELVWLPHIE